MKISIVVPAFNEEKLLGATLQSIQAASISFTKIGWQTELIVCDNNSTDKTADIARAAGAVVVPEKINQIARARNTGASVATGVWLIFVDADSHPSPELFADVAEQIKGGRCIGGGCTLRFAEWHTIGSSIAWVWTLVSRYVRWAAGSFIFVRAEAFRSIGGFNLELFASEEIDLSQRLKKLAKTRREKFVILTRHPLITSARKLSLYSGREYFQFFRKAIFNPRTAVKSRDACVPWYDGRR